MSGALSRTPAGRTSLHDPATAPAPPPSGADPPVVVADGLSKRYGPRWALRGLDLSLRRGERIAVVGPNGAGKSTLIRLLALLSPPSAGRVFVAGLDSREHDRRIRALLGVVLHDSLLYADLTVAENLLLAARLYSVAGREERVRSLLERFELTRLQGTRIRQLSRGQRQRTALARALVHDPPILLLDEPDTGLDAAAFGHLTAELVGAEDRTIVFTTHHPGHALELGTRVLLLREGRTQCLADASRWTTPALAELLLRSGSSGSGER